jgi:hypothetical protein
LRLESDPYPDAEVSPLVLVSELDRRGRELDTLCDALTSCPIGDPVTAPRPVLSSPQHGFITAAIWLSSWLDEAWSTSMDYLFSQAMRVGINAEEAQQFKYILGRLRTFFAHNLDPSTPRDRRTRDECYLWFKEACGSRFPGDDQWGRCLDTLLQSAVRYVSLATEIARAIERHSDGEDLRSLWANRLSRTGVMVDYLGLLQRAAGDLGCEGMDLHSVHQRHRRRWDRSLALPSADSDVDDVTVRHVERTLLAETVPLLPITASNIMERLQLQPGESVAVALRLDE